MRSDLRLRISYSVPPRTCTIPAGSSFGQCSGTTPGGDTCYCDFTVNGQAICDSVNSCTTSCTQNSDCQAGEACLAGAYQAVCGSPQCVDYTSCAMAPAGGKRDFFGDLVGGINFRMGRMDTAPVERRIIAA